MPGIVITSIALVFVLGLFCVNAYDMLTRGEALERWHL